MIRASTKLKAEMTLLGVVIIWGYTFPVIKNVLETIPPFTFLTYRFLLASSAFFLIFQKKLKKITLQMVGKGFLLGLFLFIGYFGQTVGTQFTTATKTAFITGISVVLVPIFSFFWFKEKLRLNSLLGVLLATVGLFLMNSNEEFYNINKGDALVFLCAVAFALYIVFVHIYTKKYDYVSLVFIQLVTIFLMSFLVSVFFERKGLYFYPEFSVLWAIIVTGVLATGLALYLQNRFQQYSSPTKIAIIFSTEPVFGALFSHLILSETIGVSGVIGGIVIFIGMLIAQLEKDEKRPTTA